jgi:hypothetical protein
MPRPHRHLRISPRSTEKWGRSSRNLGTRTGFLNVFPQLTFPITGHHHLLSSLAQKQMSSIAFNLLATDSGVL